MNWTRIWLILALLIVSGGTCATAERLDLQRYKNLREAEREVLDKAQGAFEAAKWGEAIAHYRRFLAGYPEHFAVPFAQYMLGSCYERKRDFDRAVRLYRDVLERHPASPEGPKAQFALARRLEGSYGPEKAAPEYQMLLEKYPKHPLAADVLWHLSIGDLARKEPAGAVEKRSRIVEHFGEHRLFRPAAEWLIAHYLFTENRESAAREICQRLRPGPDTELHLAALYRDRASALLKGEDRAHGQECLERAIVLYRGFTTQFPELRDKLPDCELAIADCYMALGKTEEAVRQCEAFPTRYPWAQKSFSAAMKKIIQAHKSRGAHDQVQKSYLRYFERWPDDDGTRKEFGRFLEETLGAWDDARAQYRLMRNKMDGQWEVACSFHRQGKADEAIEGYQSMKGMVWCHLSFYRIGQVYQHLKKDYPKAIKAYRDSECSPPEYLFRIAECHCEMREWEKALAICEEIQGAFKNRVPEAMRFMVERIYEKRQAPGDREKAITVLKKWTAYYRDSWPHHRLEEYGIKVNSGGMKKER